MRSKDNKFRSDIAALRALAVLLVLLSHFRIPGFGFGFIGVDIFFVISGYLITRILFAEYVSSGENDPTKSSISLSVFYLRRIRRLMPAAIITIIIVNILSFFINNPLTRISLMDDSKWALFFLANVAFLRSESDYFQQGSEPSFLQHYWSLSVEEQFYFIWPILFLIAANLQKLRVLGKYIRFNHRILILIALISSLSFFFMLFSFSKSPNETYFAIFTRAWELGLGSFFGILAFNKSKQTVFSSLEKLLPIVIAIFISFLFINSKNWAYFVAIPVFATGFLLFAGQENPIKPQNTSALLSHLRKFVLYIGGISYSLYLVHWPIFLLANHLGVIEKISMRLAMLPVCVFFGHLLWKYVEVPFQRITIPKRFPFDEHFFKFAKSRRIFIYSIFIALLGSLYVATYPSVSSKVFYSDSKLRALSEDPNLKAFSNFQSKILGGTSSSGRIVDDSQSQSTPMDLRSLEAEVSQGLEDGLKSTKLSDEQILALKSIKQDQNPYEKACPATNTEIPNDCSVGSRNENAKRVALIGDSKMAAIAQPIIEYFVRKGWSVTPMTMAGCHLSDPSNVFFSNCSKRSAWTLNKIVQSKYDLVISSEWPGVNDVTYVTNYLSTIQKNTEKFIILQAHPSVPSAVNCIAPDFTYTATCSTIDPANIISMQKLDKVINSLKSSNMSIVNTRAWICRGNICPITSNGAFVTRDGSHLTYSYLKKITPLINATLDSISIW